MPQARVWVYRENAHRKSDMDSAVKKLGDFRLPVELVELDTHIVSPRGNGDPTDWICHTTRSVEVVNIGSRQYLLGAKASDGRYHIVIHAGEKAPPEQSRVLDRDYLKELLIAHGDDALDDLVHERKAEEALAINNAGADSQIAYLLGEEEWETR